jgi:hypothetical protein
MELLAEILFIYIGRYPGAFFLWIFTGFRKSIRYYLNHDNAYGIGFFGMVMCCLVYAVIVALT